MPNYTTKLNLEKPLGTEYYNVLTVQNVNSDKIDAFATATELKNNCMAGGDIKGYIEDGGSHVVGEVWLSRNVKGEFKCLVTNSDNYIDVTPGAEKWVQIDDLTNDNRITELEFYKNNYSLAGDFNFIFQVETYGKICILAMDSVNYFFDGVLETNQVLATLPTELRPLKTAKAIFTCKGGIGIPFFVDLNGDIRFIGTQTYLGINNVFYGQIVFAIY